MSEYERIRRIYGQRDSNADLQRRYDPLNAANLFITQERERALLKALCRAGHDSASISGLKILSVGCGFGGELTDFLRYGASITGLYGLDMLSARLRETIRRTGLHHIVQADAQEMPYRTGSFDLVTQFTLFSSVLDPRIRKRIADEMLRVLRRPGLVLWYDLRTNNPMNPQVRGVSRAEISTLFQHCSVRWYRTTLAPPITRFVVPRSRLIASILSKLPALRTHYLAVIRPTM